jgi:hypothetical protein
LNTRLGKKRGESVASKSESSDEEDEDDGVIPGAWPTHEVSSDASDEEQPEDEGLSGFIEQDSNQVIELPAEFSMNTYQDLMHHFKIICQLFVHLAVRPVNERRGFMQQSLKGGWGFVRVWNLCLLPSQTSISLSHCRSLVGRSRVCETPW